MQKKLFDSELKLMEMVWENEPVSAKELSIIASERIGWNKNTTYTVIKKLVEKKMIHRSEPGFICTSLISKDDVRKAETEGLIKRLYNGSKKALFSALIEDETLSEAELDELRKMLEKR
ncbi:MAG TPA: BlaI/MecI/CopY family transcriptional regulator [Acetivibrio sp.]|nr:BlaI/MecI/CopY family transcriptional regulator [Clostridium sp.]HQA58157.1 BlaI/MecI/CopY family transcriptional regulator [Acetivibrio sp.]